MQGTGDFEVCENGTLAVSGRVSVAESPVLRGPPPEHRKSTDSSTINASEIYKELRLRGYDYGQSFQGILSSNTSGKPKLAPARMINLLSFCKKRICFYVERNCSDR